MQVAKWIVVLFIIAALYDGILGLAFLIAPGRRLNGATSRRPTMLVMCNSRQDS